MTDPYSVLGVSPNATDDEVKKAYRQLCKRYHPDANVGRPDAKQAEERFLQVQQAYEEIMNRRQGKIPNGGGAQYQYQEDPFSPYYGAYGQNTRTRQETPEMQAAFNYIANGRYAEAINALGAVDPGDRTARWYYLSALAHNGLHNTAQAMEYAQQAVSMEPSNMDYQQLLSALQQGGYAYRSAGSHYGRMNVNWQNICCGMMALNLCCGGGMCYTPLFCCI